MKARSAGSATRVQISLALGAWVGAAALWASPSLAQDESDVEDVSLDAVLDRKLDDQLGTTTAASRKMESVIKAPATISALTSDEIRFSGANTIPDLLRWVPGVQVYRNGPGNHIVALRGTGGLSGNNVVVTLNGIPMNNPLDGSVDWDSIPLHVNDIERVEVVRGPVSTIYGANAYTGVVNIVTKQAFGTSAATAARIEAGLDGESGMLGGLSGRHLDNDPGSRVAIFAIGRVDHTGSTGPGGPVPPVGRFGTMAHIELLPAGSTQLVLDLGVSRSTRSGLDHFVLEANPQTRSLIFGAVRFALRDVSPLVSSVEAWARTTVQTTSTDPAAYSGFSYAHTKGSRTGAGTDLGFRLGSHVTATAGAEAAVDWIDAPYMNPSANARAYSSYGLHGSVGLAPLPELDLTVGVRGDRLPAGGELQASYRASAVYSRTDWALRVSGASAYRSPSYVELGGRFVDPASGLILLEGNPEMRSPRNHTIEVGAVMAPVAELHITPTVYASRLEDVVVEDFEPLVLKSFENNPVPHDLLGAELEVEWAVRDGLSVAASGAALRWLSSDETGTVGVPKQSSTFIGGLRTHGTLLHERIGFGLGGTYASSREFAVRAGIPPVIIETKLPAVVRLTAALEYNLSLRLPLWISLRGESSLPTERTESPIPAAARTPTMGIVSLEYRED